MKKIDLSGGVSSVVAFPTPMKNGGDLSVPPPKSATPPKQFTLPGYREPAIPSEPNVQPRTMDQRGGYFNLPVPDGPMSSEPDFDIDMGTVRPEMKLEERFMYGPIIDPREVYPYDPDRGIHSPYTPFPDNSVGGIPNLLQSNYLKPAGILSINKTYDI